MPPGKSGRDVPDSRAADRRKRALPLAFGLFFLLGATSAILVVLLYWALTERSSFFSFPGANLGMVLLWFVGVGVVAPLSAALGALIALSRSGAAELTEVIKHLAEILEQRWEDAHSSDPGGPKEEAEGQGRKKSRRHRGSGPSRSRQEPPSSKGTGSRGTDTPRPSIGATARRDRPDRMVRRKTSPMPRAERGSGGLSSGWRREGGEGEDEENETARTSAPEVIDLLIRVWDRCQDDGSFHPGIVRRELSKEGLDLEVHSGVDLELGKSVIAVMSPNGDEVYLLPSFNDSPAAVRQWFDNQGADARLARIDHLIQPAVLGSRQGNYELKARGAIA